MESKTFNEIKMAHSSECTEHYAQKAFDRSDIVREAMFQQLTSRTNYSGIIPILFSHVSTNGGHPVIGIFVRRMPNPWPP